MSKRYDGPSWTCAACGCVDHERFRTVKYDTMDGIEYDMECPECGANEIEETVRDALCRAIDELDRLKAKIPDASLAADLEEAANLIELDSECTRDYQKSVSIAARLRAHAQKLKGTK